MRRPRSVALLLSGALAVGLMPSAIAQPSSRIHELKGVNHFTATTTSSILVRFPKRIAFHEEFNASHRGNGRIRGFVLRKAGEFEQEGHRPVMHSVNIGKCTRRGCKAREVPYIVVCFECEGGLAGVWELYVIADGAPVTVTFELKGVRGRTRSRVTGRVRSEIRTLQPQVQERAEDRVYSAGGFTKLDQADFGFFGLWLAGNPYPATALGECIYREGRIHPPEDVAFAPGCPMGHRPPFLHVNPSMGRASTVLKSVSYCCAPGLGGWYATAASVKRYGSVVLWIDF